MSTQIEPHGERQEIPMAAATQSVHYPRSGKKAAHKTIIEAAGKDKLRRHRPRPTVCLEAAVVISADAARDETPLDSGGLRLLQHTAELANAALCLSDGVASVEDYLATALGWRALGWRVFTAHPEVAAATHAGIDPHVEVRRLLATVRRSSDAAMTTGCPVLLQVADGERLFAMTAFVAPGGVDDERRRLLSQVASQLLALARRDAFQQFVLARELEILRQGQLAGMAELAQGLSHELSQPLTALAVYAGALQRRLSQEQDRYHEIAYLSEQLLQQVERAGATLQVAKSFIVRRSCATGSVDVEKAIRQLQSLLLPSLQAASVKLRFVIAPGLPPARGSEAHLVQIVLGLLANALTALQQVAPDARRLVLEVMRAEREIHLRVIDNGLHPLPLSADEPLPFFTAYSDSSRVSLAISRSLAEIQGGRLWREDHGKETVHGVALPLLH